MSEYPDGGLVLTGAAEECANLDALTLHGTGIPDTVREQGHGRVIPGISMVGSRLEKTFVSGMIFASCFT